MQRFELNLRSFGCQKGSIKVQVADLEDQKLDNDGPTMDHPGMTLRSFPLEHSGLKRLVSGIALYVCPL